MQVKLVTITPDAEKIIAYCARVSNPNNQNNPEIAKLIGFCIKHNHWSILEQASMTLEIETSVVISSQILRHKSMKFQQFSGRYQSLTKNDVEFYQAREQDTKNRQNSTDTLPDIVKMKWDVIQQNRWDKAIEDYQWALDNGIAKECARMILPLQSKTRMYVTADIRSWVHYIQVRTDPSTQKEHRDVALECKRIFIEQLPIVSEALGWYDEDTTI